MIFASPRRVVLALAATVLALAAAAGLAARTAPGRTISHRLDRIPQTVLWAWERPEDLRFVDPKTTGVAFLARTIELRGTRVAVRPRLNSLQVPDETVLVAVARIETARDDRPELSSEQRARVAETVAALARIPSVVAVQIDFDAKVSERAFYRALLADVRALLPDEMALTMTSLASWAFHDDWISDLPVDEAVPMLFRMGADDHQIRSMLKRGEDFRSPLCRSSLGVATDEPLPRLPAGRRVYVFHSASWTKAVVSGQWSVVSRREPLSATAGSPTADTPAAPQESDAARTDH